MDADQNPLYLLNGNMLFEVEVILDAAKREVNSPASDALIDAVAHLVAALKPIASPVDPMRGVAYRREL